MGTEAQKYRGMARLAGKTGLYPEKEAGAGRPVQAGSKIVIFSPLATKTDELINVYPYTGYEPVRRKIKNNLRRTIDINPVTQINRYLRSG